MAEGNMKTCFNAKIIFESENMTNPEALESLTRHIDGKEDFSFGEFANAVNDYAGAHRKFKLEVILDNFQNCIQPVIIIKEIVLGTKNDPKES